ncbi:hypothetical protein CANCADRAFT_98038 [Tortispora caseinolytica NRRL Y-17796]|uniref:P-loop containing nucleoside triphosphate hydrolase protein n=1 Tax=Tortispora caseinolytica NRRL Y-17796 TaxID=767744 RepID=A0A1E4TDS4_9ASCO|nr:hypothetical protein CANCADRAFT_98038 [Tortispora caseinolytica NRRL Y-17796]
MSLDASIAKKQALQPELKSARFAKLVPFADKGVPTIPETPAVSPEKQVNIVSQMLYSWVFPTVWTGYRRKLVENDMYELAKDRDIEVLVNRLTAAIDRRKAAALEADPDNPNYDKIVLKAANEVFGPEWWSGVASRIFGDLCQGMSPIVLREVIEFTAQKTIDPSLPVGRGIGAGIGLCLMLLAFTIASQFFFYHCTLAGIAIRNTLTCCIFQKSLKLSNKAKMKYNSGLITSMMATDTSRLEYGAIFVTFLPSSVIMILISIIILLVYLTYSALAGIGLLVVMTPLLGVLTRMTMKRRRKISKVTDERIRVMQEILNSMRAIKYYAWENAFVQKVLKIRHLEVSRLNVVNSIRYGIVAIAMSISTLASMLSFIVLFYSHIDFNSATIFSSLTLFNMMRLPLIFAPIALNHLVDSLAAFERINDFLLAEEWEDYVLPMSDEKNAIVLENASFVWEVSEPEQVDKPVPPRRGLMDLFSKKKPTESVVSAEEKHDDFSSDAVSDSSSALFSLKDLNLAVAKGELIVITGAIGTGKSSLLSAICGAMRKTSGNLRIDGSLVYCSDPWVLNTTVRNNITFGRPFDSKRYQQIIDACALKSDLTQFPNGDMTEIGERGITISGGQKARINLARAAYHYSDIVVMDDVLSAVDSHVAKHIIENCLNGVLAHATRIIATHQLHVLDYADRVIFTPGDGTIRTGTVAELREKEPAFASLLESGQSSVEQDEDANETASLARTDSFTRTPSIAQSSYSVELEDEVPRELGLTDTHSSVPDISASVSKQSRPVSYRSQAFAADSDQTEVRDATITQSEVYYQYWKASSASIGAMSFFIVLLMVALGAGGQTLCGVWLQFWITDRFMKSGTFYIGILVLITISASIFFGLYGLSVAVFCGNAARRLNIMAVERIVRTPMAFFDTTPLGRILNRFSKDTDSMDNALTDSYRLLFQGLFMIIASYALSVSYFYYFAIAVIPLALTFVICAGLYSASSGEAKHIESIARSKAYAHFNESLAGITQIRSYGEQDRFIQKQKDLLRLVCRAGNLSTGIRRWLGMRLDLVAVVTNFIIAMLAVNTVLDVDASAVGLVLAYMTAILGLMSFTVQHYSEVREDMNSTERIYEYANRLESEAPLIIEDNRPPANWPTRAEIVFDHVVFGYRPGLPDVLKDISLHIESGQKIGICGRTGAGKSSIMNALFRLTELRSGRILIDDIDCAGLGLHDLRTKLAIIPQDPVLFRGTVRSNLDPFDNSNDLELWGALRRAGAIRTEADVESNHKFHLDQKVDDDAANYSLGERQILALARALVRNSKILILDEATSSVDYETDERIQASIAKEFAHSTILCIAHRLRTILGYDRILVLEKGEIAEFDEPLKLFLQENSIFRSMCDKSSITEAEFPVK